MGSIHFYIWRSIPSETKTLRHSPDKRHSHGGRYHPGDQSRAIVVSRQRLPYVELRRRRPLSTRPVSTAVMAGAGGWTLSKYRTFLALISHRRLSTAASVDPIPAGARARRKPPPPAHFSVAEYLVQTCGLSEKDAEAASPALARLRSADKPDAVLRLLRDRGLSGGEIASLVSSTPQVLCFSEKGDLPGKFDFLVSLGFSAAEVAELLQKTVLLNRLTLSSVKKRAEFIRSIVDTDRTKLIKRAAWMLTGGNTIERRLNDNITKLREWGVSDERIKALIIRRPRFYRLRPEFIDDAAAVAEGEFGIDRRSKMFVHAVSVLCSVPEPLRQSKFKVFESFGWSKSDIFALFRVFPACLYSGVDRIARQLEFLMNKAGLTPACILKGGCLLGMSLEKRLVPRHELLGALKAENVSSKRMRMSFSVVARMSEEDFQRKFVSEFIDVEPDACKLYLSRCKNVRDVELG